MLVFLWLLYGFLERFAPDPIVRQLVLVAYGLGSMAMTYSILFYWASLVDVAVVMSTFESPSPHWYDRPDIMSLIAIVVLIGYIVMSHKQLTLADVRFPHEFAGIAIEHVVIAGHRGDVQILADDRRRRRVVAIARAAAGAKSPTDAQRRRVDAHDDARAVDDERSAVGNDRRGRLSTVVTNR